MDHGNGGSDRVTFGPMQHAFIPVGTKQLFIVHMTNMWIDCHQYQAIFRVQFPDDVKETFLADREENPSEVYVLGNLDSDLMSLHDIKRGARTTFKAGLWRGFPPQNEGTPMWPWANDPPVATDFDVTVDRVVYFRRFDFQHHYPRTLTYVLFGEGDEAFLNHYQVKNPEFDQVVQLAEAPSWLDPALLEAGVPINVPSIPPRPEGIDAFTGVYCKDPLPEGTVDVQFGGYGPTRPLSIDRTVWFSTWPVNKADPCAAPNPEDG